MKEQGKEEVLVGEERLRRASERSLCQTAASSQRPASAFHQPACSNTEPPSGTCGAVVSADLGFGRYPHGAFL